MCCSNGKSPGALAKAEEDQQYGADPEALRELNEKYPNRPHNHAPTFFFSDLVELVFHPLLVIKQKPTGPTVRSKAKGKSLTVYEQRTQVIQTFIKRWREDVGNDIYPAMRLILSDHDRDRGVYGLKEATIAKLLVKIMRIDKSSADAQNLVQWKLPGQALGGLDGGMAGDFAGRCYQVLKKRRKQDEDSDIRLSEINVLLDKLATAQGEKEQLPIVEQFYQRLNAEEMMWLVRIMLRQPLKFGAGESYFLNRWHPDGETLFNVSSSLRRVCWELWDPTIRLPREDQGVTLMECFQPQLAAFQDRKSFADLVKKLLGRKITDEDKEEFWIEEKLDGERMQLHMRQDEQGEAEFKFWSRKGKDYTYLYGSSFDDQNSALTKHLKGAFAKGVRNIILDGEMITFDPETGKMITFGTLKTAALEQQRSFFQSGPRPVFRVFDILFLNDKVLTNYALRSRREALERVVLGKKHRLEILEYTTTDTPDAVEPALRRVIADAGEGLVLKNPASTYQLAERNHNWVKVKPDYMEDFGESIDVVVIGGYFGSGHRGGTLSSFLCGVRPGKNQLDAGISPEKVYSFCKVGGGFKGEDYREIKRLIGAKMVDWDAKRPPTQYIELGGGEKMQCEKPDVWVRPSESIVVCVKAASITPSGQFGMGWTLRFPRFKKIRTDKNWDQGLDVDELESLITKVTEHEKEKKMEMEAGRRRASKRVKRELVIVGTDPAAQAEFAKESKMFEGLEFCVLSESMQPVRKSKAELEQLIKENGGTITQRPDPSKDLSEHLIIGDKRVVRVASLMKDGKADIVRPKWIFDCLAQPESDTLLPFEEGHFFHANEGTLEEARENCDQYGDPYLRAVDEEELSRILKRMPANELDEMELDSDEEDLELLTEGLKSWLFRRCRVYFAGEGNSDPGVMRLQNYVRFGHGEVSDGLEDREITHVVVGDEILTDEMYTALSCRARLPRLVTREWVEDSWKEGTRLDEERYALH